MKILVDLKYIKREHLLKLAKTSKDLSLLKELSNSQDEDIRKNVALNNHANDAILHHLSFDGKSCVRQSVAENPSTPAYVLEHLSKDCEDIAARVAKNPKTSLSTLLHLAKRGEPLVKREASSRIKKGKY